MSDPSAFDPQDYLPDWLKRVVSPGSDPGSDSILGYYSGIPLPAAPAAPDIRQWQGSPPATVLNPNPISQGATGLGDLTPVRTYPDGTALVPAGAFPTVIVKPDLPPGGPNAAAFPDPVPLANSIYHETSGQRLTAGGPTLDSVRNAMANARLNAQGQVPVGPGYMASPDISRDQGAIFDGILHPPKPGQTDLNENQAAAAAWFSSLDAALSALNRTSAPTAGPESGVFFNGRRDAGTGPNTNPNNPQQEPFVGTIGPYYSPNHLPYWAFFGKPGK